MSWVSANKDLVAVKRWPLDGDVGPRRTISGQVRPFMFDLSVLANAAGDTVVGFTRFFSRPDGTRWVPISVYRPAGGPWGPPLRVADTDAQARLAVLALQEAGDVEAAWQDGVRDDQLLAIRYSFLSAP
ncbi:hypothetical protein D0Z08_00980 [Nocardioides immobilis]|uniref:Uncharacterized protein n=1 Tax=Nocardioides immobilis TaxID=2049295 RepID=A0A417Y6W2_9ACTN|nr:hypothetical protein [Nocardioides immobilis]RHW28482.1 hypothetical protein D0Z08_00980 [Nocardioides immobilis]